MTQFDRGDLSVELADHVATVEICRPPHNFFDLPMIDDLASILEQLDDTPDCRAVVLAARGKSFCAGGNFADAAGAIAKDAPARLYGHAARLFATRKPVVAALHGPAIGGGLGLALFADFRVVSPEARFAANFVKLGTHPGFGISLTLPRLVGEQRAALMLYTGRRLNGAEALEWGLADAIAESDELRAAAMAIAREIAENAPLAVTAVRATLRQGMAEAITARIAVELKEQMRLFATEDHREGVAAVSERRPGVFHGK